jgi:DNA-directed RNA polymerase subunit E'/Rpb7
MENSIFMKMLLTDKIKLEPSFLSKSFKDEILKRLKLKVEGICTRHGFVKPDSIEIHKICAGRVEMIGLNGNTQYDVLYHAEVCNPLIGSIIRCKVSNINKFGILAEAGTIIEAIIAKNSVNIQSEIDLEKIRIGDEVLIEIVGKKYELNDKKISLIGRIVKDTSIPKTIPIEKQSSLKRSPFDNTEEDEVEDIDDIENIEDIEGIRSIEGGSDVDSEEENSDGEEEADPDDPDADPDVDPEVDANVEEEDDVEEEEDDNEDDGANGQKFDGNFYSDDEDPYLQNSDDEEPGDDDDDASVQTDEE